MVDHGCDNGRLFCVRRTRVQNLSSQRGRKTNEEKINSQFAILQSLVLLCDVLTGGSALSACGSGSQSRGSSMPNPSPPHTHTHARHTLFHTHFPYKGLLRGTPGHRSVFLLYSMIVGVIQIRKQCCRHFSISENAD